VKYFLSPEWPQIIAELSDCLLFCEVPIVNAFRDHEHIEQIISVKGRSSVTAPGSPIDNSTAGAAASVILRRRVKSVVHDVVHFGAACGATHIYIVARHMIFELDGLPCGI
jgi:hypothetical protein